LAWGCVVDGGFDELAELLLRLNLEFRNAGVQAPDLVR
jgi:hypothetical protein